MAIRLFGKHRNKTEKKAEMKYNEGMTFIANGRLRRFAKLPSSGTAERPGSLQ